MAVFDRGDIVRVCLNPTEGKELQGEFRPCLVLSPKPFNKLGLTLIVPITQGGDFARFKGFAVPLSGCGTETQGVVLAHGIRSMGLQKKKAKKVESAPDYIVQDVIAKLSTLILE